jgi:sugar lactone lactonase YvrE
VLRFAPNGTSLGTVALAGSAFQEGMAVDAAGNIYVADGSIIKRFSPAGVDLGPFATGVGGPGGHGGVLVTELTFDREGNLFVVEQDAKRIHVFSPSGVDLGVLATFADFPAGLVFDTAGNLFVNFIQGFPIGLIRKIPVGGGLNSFATTGYWPHAMAFAEAGNLWCANYGSGTITRFSPAGADLGTLQTLANGWIRGPLGLAFRP